MNMASFIITGILTVSVEKAVIALVLAVILVTASITDIKILKVPYFCSLSMLIIGLITMISSVVQGKDHWIIQLLGIAFIVLAFTVPTFMGHIGGGDYQLMAASGLVLGLRSTIIAVLIALFLGFVGSLIVVITTRRDERVSLQNVVCKVFCKWYEIQKINNSVLRDKENDTVFFSIINNKVYIDEYCYNNKKWTSDPDTDCLRSMLESDIDIPSSNYSIKICASGADDDLIRKISCKKTVPFVPFLSAGIIISFILFA